MRGEPALYWFAPSGYRHWTSRRGVLPDKRDPKVYKEGCPRYLWFSSGWDSNPDTGEVHTHML